MAFLSRALVLPTVLTNFCMSESGLKTTLVALNSMMQYHQATSSIVNLPDEVLTTVVIALTSHAHGNPGDVCRLMLVCSAAKPIFAASARYVKTFHSELPKAESVHARDGALLATELRETGLGVRQAASLLAPYIHFASQSKFFVPTESPLKPTCL